MGVKQKEFDMLYTIKDGDKYLLCEDGSVFFTDKENINKYLDNPLEVPYSNDPNENLDVFVIDGKMGLYNGNMKQLNTYVDAWGVVADCDYGNYSEEQFFNFNFPEKY